MLVKYKTAIITMTLSWRQQVACSPRDITYVYFPTVSIRTFLFPFIPTILSKYINIEQHTHVFVSINVSLLYTQISQHNISAGEHNKDRFPKDR